MNSIKERKLHSQYPYVYLGSLFFILIFGGIIYSQFGKFEFTSTTGPVNLLIGANDDATGGFNATVHEQGKSGFIENSNQLTYIQKGEFYQAQAIKWIKENPVKWLLLAPMKLLLRRIQDHGDCHPPHESARCGTPDHRRRRRPIVADGPKDKIIEALQSGKVGRAG